MSNFHPSVQEYIRVCEALLSIGELSDEEALAVEQKLDRIFTPFSQVDNRYDRQAGGTGLGLALVRGLAELHGGRAWLESEPGKGCCAYVVLPVTIPEPKVEESVAA